MLKTILIIAISLCPLISFSNAYVYSIVMGKNINDSTFIVTPRDTLICYPGDLTCVSSFEWIDPDDNHFVNQDSLLITKESIEGLWRFEKKSSDPDNNFNIQYTINYVAFNPPRELNVQHLYEIGTNYYNACWMGPVPSTEETLVGYNIYVNEVKCFYTTRTDYSTTEYPIIDILGGIINDFTFHITAVYENPSGESDSSNKFTCMLAVPVIQDNFSSYNTAFSPCVINGNLVFPAGSRVRKLKIFDSSGKLIDLKQTEGLQAVSLKEYRNGVYTFQFITDKGLIIRKIAVTR